MAEEPFVNFEGTWKNQHQSILELSVVDGLVRGRFQSSVGENGQPLWAEINGRILGDVITFHAVYPLYRTIVTWIGQHLVENGIGSIHTHWLHATDIKERVEHEWMWYSNRIGSDIFTRT